MALQFFIDYLIKEKNYSPHTITAYKNDLMDFSQFIALTYNDTIENANYAMVRSWIVSLVETGISNRTVNRKVSSLKSFYKFLMKIGDIEVSPLAKHTALKTVSKIQIPFSQNEMEQALAGFDEQAQDFKTARNKLMVLLFYSTGMRRAELIHLKIQDISLNAKTIKVLGKRNKERLIPLLQSLCKDVQVYLTFREKVVLDTNNAYLFVTSKGAKVYDTLVYRVITSYFDNVSVKLKKSPHILRHTFATHLLNQGANLNAVKELLGHSSLASTQVYTHNNIAQLKKVYQGAHPRNKK